jgi:deoxyribonuclease-4
VKKKAGKRLIGAHAPAAGGLAKAAIPYLAATGSDVVQVYVSNPRGWALADGDPAQDKAFVAGSAGAGVPTFIHASLLVNLGSPTPATVENSVRTLRHALARGQRLEARGVVFHAGSAVDPSRIDQAYKQLREALLPVLDDAAAAGGPRLLVEPSAGGGRSLAARLEDLEPYLAAVDHHPWLGVCFDTCHVWAAGHDLAVPGGMTAALDQVNRLAPGRLWLVHANDSKDGCGSLRDRHETIGAGALGLAAFEELIRHPAMDGVPTVVETPGAVVGSDGLKGAPGSGHARDIAALRALQIANPAARRH